LWCRYENDIMWIWRNGQTRICRAG